MTRILDMPAGAATRGDELLALLRREIDCYKRLLRLSIRQNRYLRGQDALRLELNTEEWHRYLPLADQARGERVAAMDRLFDIHGIARRDCGPLPLLPHLPVETGEALRRLRDEWNAVVEELTRQNALNGMLTRFCLDTIREEAEIFRTCLADADGGCYDGRGALAGNGAAGRGVIAQQA